MPLPGQLEGLLRPRMTAVSVIILGQTAPSIRRLHTQEPPPLACVSRGDGEGGEDKGGAIVEGSEVMNQ